MAAKDETRIVYGPFHRLLAEDVQDASTIVKQLLSGELWGKRARFGADPAAKAYRGPLREADQGFEFWAIPGTGQPIWPSCVLAQIGRILGS